VSYARLGGDSDVYLYREGDQLCCQFCSVSPSGFHAADPAEMLKHMMEHRARGEKVPDHAITRLEGDVAAGKIRPLYSEEWVTPLVNPYDAAKPVKFKIVGYWSGHVWLKGRVFDDLTEAWREAEALNSEISADVIVVFDDGNGVEDMKEFYPAPELEDHR
jgi:hypothetical protein